MIFETCIDLSIYILIVSRQKLKKKKTTSLSKRTYHRLRLPNNNEVVVARQNHLHVVLFLAQINQFDLYKIHQL